MSAPNQNYIYLHKVDAGENNNKFYEMKANADGTFTSTYGREGAAKPQQKQYSMSLWESTYREKTSSKKGYTDITNLKSVPKETKTVKNSNGQIISKDPEVLSLITHLQNAANVVTKANYEVEAKSVTKAQVDAAQAQIDVLSTLQKEFGTKSWNLDKFNKELAKLMVIITRKMKNVADHMISPTDDAKEIAKRLNEEQDLLDSMASQVIANVATEEAEEEAGEQPTLLDALGLSMRPATAAEIKEAKAQCQTHGHKVKRVFVVVNKATQTVYDADMKKATNKKTRLLWHGSRSANWWFILQQGLKIRPSNAASFAGSAFGDGIYFAHEDDKSMGYTDGGRWNGNSRTSSVFMALFEVRVGKQYEIFDNRTLSSVTTKRALEVLKSNGDCDSTWARKASDNPAGRNTGYYGLVRDELIIYKSEQATIKYLIEFAV